jgi:hypothetical protein
MTAGPCVPVDDKPPGQGAGGQQPLGLIRRLVPGVPGDAPPIPPRPVTTLSAEYHGSIAPMRLGNTVFQGTRAPGHQGSPAPAGRAYPGRTADRVAL